MKKKVGIVTGGLSGGGTERFAANLSNYLCESGVDVFLYTKKKENNEYKLNQNINRRELMCFHFVKDMISIKNDLEKNEIMILVGLGIYSNLCACFAKCMGYKGKIVISERNDPKHDLISMKSRMLRQILYPLADTLVFQTQQARDFYPRYIQKKGIVIHNPIKEDLPTRSEITNKEIVFAGRLRVQKNPKLMLDSFLEIHQKHPDYKLRFFGIGPLEKDLKETVYRNGLEEAVVFEGWQSNVHNMIVDSDIFVMTSDFEGMPNSLMEAMAMGFPVISSDCPAGGPAELITDGVNGMLFKVGDKHDLIQKIEYLLDHTIEKENMGKKAKKIRDTHAIEEIAKKWVEIL